MDKVDRAVILAAGMGTRLKWMTNQRPKALMQVNGEAVIVHVIRQLVAQGINQITVNAHHHADQLIAYLGDGSRFGCHITISLEDQLLDSGGGVKKALSLLPGSGPVAVYNADVLADIDVQRLAQKLRTLGSTIALVKNPAHHQLGDFSLHGDQLAMRDDQRFTFAGVSVWHDAVLQACADTTFSLARLIRECIAQGKCSGIVHRGYWFDIGRPADLMRARRMLGRLI